VNGHLISLAKMKTNDAIGAAGAVTIDTDDDDGGITIEAAL
jgi:hypothetical protein